jgi:antitoxin (DNA-binding transcriptional repressor) of toxin-antitoxin stability system
VILRHGKPAAAIVPVDVAKGAGIPLDETAAAALLDRLACPSPPNESIDDALGRSRWD